MATGNMDLILPLSEQHIAAIGRVTAYFSLLETSANALISDLLSLKSQEDVVSITAHMMFSTKIQLLRTLASTRFQEDNDLGKFLSETLNDMEKANVQRNTIVHASWYYYSPDKNESGALKRTARGKIATSLEGFTPDEICDIAKLILVTSGKAQQFLLRKNGTLQLG